MDTGVKPEQHLPTEFCKGGNQVEETLETDEAGQQKKRSCSTWQLVGRFLPFTSRAQRSACFGALCICMYVCVCVNMFLCIYMCLCAFVYTHLCAHMFMRMHFQLSEKFQAVWSYDRTCIKNYYSGCRGWRGHRRARSGPSTEGKEVRLREMCLDRRRGGDGEDGWLGEACQVTVIYWT